MAAELTQWLTTAQANVTTLTAQEEEQKAKLKKLNRKAQKKRRLARIREAKRAKAIMQMEDEIGKVQGQMRELVEAERQRSERFLSLARKYYGMWKTLNEKCQQKSAWKSQSSQAKDSNSNVAVLREQNFTFPVAVTSVTMDKRFSDSTTSSPFQIVGETLNISNSI